MKVAQEAFRLKSGSVLLRRSTWIRLDESRLKPLIQRFATRERSRLRYDGVTGFAWKQRRLRAVDVFEARFGPAPPLFRHRGFLPRLRSYYTGGGEYLWPRRSSSAP